MEATELVVVPEEHSGPECGVMQQTDDELRSYLRLLEAGSTSRPTPPRLVFEDGTQFELPRQVLQVLHLILHHLSSGDAVNVVPVSKLLTTNQAAEILNVSRPFLIKLLNEGALKYTMIGTHHRLRLSDVLEYKQRRNQETLDMLDKLAAEAQEAGNYFDE